MLVPSVEEPNLSPIPSLVAVVADMTRLVHVLDAMDEEPQGEPAILDGLALVFKGHPELVDLVDHAALGRDVAGELGVVAGLVERDVDVMPGGRLRQPAAVLVRPESRRRPTTRQAPSKSAISWSPSRRPSRSARENGPGRYHVDEHATEPLP